MNFVSLLLFIVVGIGITNIIVNAKILDLPRKYVSEKSVYFKKLLSCMLCSGFWVGVLLSINHHDIGFIYGGATISLFSYIFGSLMEYLNLSISIKEADIEYVDEEEV